MTNPLFTFGDVDGDGDTDTVLSSGIVLLSTGPGLADAGNWTSAGTSWRYAGDFNGDGMSDLLGLYVMLSDGQAFDAVPGWAAPAGDGPWHIGDFNGDGRDDLFRVAWGVTGAEMHLSTGTGFVSAGGWTGFGPGTQGWFVGDFNGDGKSDILRMVYGLAGAEVLLSTGSSFSAGRVWTTQGNLQSWTVADVNLDGKDDIIDGAGNVLLSDGSKFVAAGTVPLIGSEVVVGFGGAVGGNASVVVSSGGVLGIKQLPLGSLLESPGAQIDGLPRIVSVNEQANIRIVGLEDGQEARFIVSQTASAWSTDGSYMFQPSSEGSYGFTLQIRDAATGRIVLEQHGGREVAVYNEAKAELAASVDRLAIVDVRSTVSAQASEREWRADVHTFADLHAYVSSAFSAQHPGAGDLQEALFMMQFVSGMWAYGNLNKPDEPGEVTDNEITGPIPTSEVDADLFINSPLAACEDYASVLATLLTMSGYTNRIVINPSHVFNEALIDGQWWVLDATFGIAIDTAFDTALSSASNPTVFVFSQDTRSLGDTYRERAAEGLHEHLSVIEHGIFPNVVRMDTVSFLNQFPYGSVFTSELDLTGWISAPTVSIAQDPGALGLVELLALTSLRRLHIYEVSSEVSVQGAEDSWRQGIQSFADLTQFLLSSAPVGVSETDRALFYMQWISGIWGLGSDLPTVTASDALASLTASPTDRLALFSRLLEQDGLSHLIAIEEGAALAQVLLDGQWWTLDPTTGIAIKSDWATATNTHSEPEIYLYPVAGRQLGSPLYSADLGATLHEMLTRIANGSFEGNTADSNGWLRGADDQPPFSPDSIWSSVPSTGWHVGDFDGDGSDDVFQYVQGVSGAKVNLSDGTQFTDDGSWTHAGRGTAGWHVGDFNGDGRDDIFRYLPGTSGADMFLSNGLSFEHDGGWTPAGHGTAGWHVGDFNGDGRDDIFRYLPGTSGADMFLSTGESFVRAGDWTPAGYGASGWIVGDFNGDGKDDVLRVVPGSSSAEVFLSTGTDFERTGNWLADLGGPLNWSVGDFNGDGKDDLLHRGNGELEIFLSDGNRFVRFGSMSDMGGVLRLGDFNGDGRTDLLSFSPDGAQSSVYLSDWILPA